MQQCKEEIEKKIHKGQAPREAQSNTTMDSNDEHEQQMQ